MNSRRRRLFQYFALTATYSPAAEPEQATTIQALRNLTTASGTNLTDARLEVLKPILERRKAQLRTLRDFEIADSIAPTLTIKEQNNGRK